MADSKKSKEEYPEVPNKESLGSFDVGISERNGGSMRSQLAPYLIVLAVIGLVVVYVLST